MFELMALFGLAVVGLAIFAVLGLVLWLVKAVFKLVFLPAALVLGLLKVVAFVVLAVLALALAPVALIAVLVAIPFLILGALLSFGWSVFA